MKIMIGPNCCFWCVRSFGLSVMHDHASGPATLELSLLGKEAHQSLAAQMQKLAAAEATLAIKVRMAHSRWVNQD